MTRVTDAFSLNTSRLIILPLFCLNQAHIRLQASRIDFDGAVKFQLAYLPMFAYVRENGYLNHSISPCSFNEQSPPFPSIETHGSRV